MKRQKHVFKRAFACVMVVVMALTAVPLSGFVGLELPKWSKLFSTKASAESEGDYTYSVSNGKATITGCDVFIEGDVVLPDTLGGYPVTSIGDDAFIDCIDLTSITIPSSVTSIGSGAFSSCTGLTSIRVDSNNKYYSNDEVGVLYNIDKSCLIQYPMGNSRTSYSIPDSVTSIGNAAFADCSRLTSVTIGKRITSIGAYAFCGCGFTSITIPDSVTSIGDKAFYYCSKLSSITMTSGSNGIKSIGNWAFAYCTRLTSISIPWITNIGDYVFRGCTGLTSVTIPDSVKSIGDYAFEGCTGLTSIDIPESVTSIGNYAFRGCTGLTSIGIPDRVTSIGDYAFFCCTGLTSVTIGSSVKSIGNYAFCGCDDLTSITIAYSVESIGDSAFRDSGLTSVTIGSSVKSIGSNAFSGCASLTSVTLPECLTSKCDIGDSAFSGCYGLESIMFPDGIESIGGSAFRGCTGLKNITLPDSVTSLGDYAFSGCSKLTSIEIPENVTSIGEYAFKGCTSLESVTIDGSVTSIGRSTFRGCTSLTNIIIPYSVESIGEYAFEGCTGLKSVIIGNGVQSISAYAFSGCSNLTSITLSVSLTSIGDYAFSGCTSLGDIYYSGTVSQFVDQFDKKEALGVGNEVLFDAEIHGAIVDNSSSGSNSSANQPLKEDCLQITPYAQVGENPVGSAVKTATAKWGFKKPVYAEPDGTGIFVPKGEDDFKNPIRIKEPSYREYIIPTDVVNDLRKLTTPVFSVYMTTKDEKNCYISSVIGKKKSEDASQYIDLTLTTLEYTEEDPATFYVTSCGLNNPTYWISQGGKAIKIEDGKFFSNAVDENGEKIYNIFDMVDGFSVYVTEGPNGPTMDSVKIKLVNKVDLSEQVQQLEEMSSMNLIDSDIFNQSGNFNSVGSNGLSGKISDGFPLLGGANLDFSAFQVPIGIEINGTDVKISIGFDFFESNKNSENGEWEKKWKGFKDNCKNVEQTINELDDSYQNWQKKKNSLDNLKNLYSGNIINTGAAEKNKGWTCSFLGYIEARLNKYGKICFKEGSIMASTEFKFKYSQQAMVWVIPAYYYFELGAELALNGRVYKFDPESSRSVDWDATLKATPKFAAGGGVGISGFLSAGLRGEGSVPTKIDFRTGDISMVLEAALKFEAQALLFKITMDIIPNKNTPNNRILILGEDEQKMKRAKRVLSLQQEDPLYDGSDSETVVTIMDRDYADNTSPWLGSSSGVRKVAAKAAASSGISFTNLQTSVYNQSQAQVVTVGNKQIMVFVTDDSTRDDYNRLCLMYSVNENGSWSTPKAVYNDGNNDASPSLATDGEKVYVSWQKVLKKLTKEDEETGQNMLENMEIYLAEINAERGSVEKTKKLTNNSVYDYLPFTVVENGKASVYFVEADPAGKTNKIVRYTDTDGKTITLEESLPYVSALSAVSDEVSYCIDKDTTNNSTSDMTVFTIKDITIKDGKVSKNVSEFEKYVSEDADTSQNAYNLLTYGKMDGKQTLFVSDGSSIYYQQKDNQQNVETKKAFSTVSSIIGCLQAVNTDEGLTLLWVGYADDATEIFSCSYKNGAWGEPVQISSQGNIVSFLSTNYINEKICGACNITERVFNESTGVYDIGPTNLTSFVIEDYTDLSVSAFAPDETQMKPGVETVINCYVTQKGTEDISALKITVEDALGTNVKYQNVELKSGSTINLEIPYTVPEKYNGTTITVQVSTDKTDKDDSDNKVVLETGKNTILLNDRPIEEFDDVYILPISVENHTALAIDNLKLTYSIEDYNENTENESVTMDLDSLTENHYVNVRIAIKKDSLVYNEYGFARINVAVNDGEEDISSLVTLIENPDFECQHTVTEEIVEIPATCMEKGKAVVKCSGCGKVISGGEEIPAIGHKETSAYNAVAPTCTAAGKEADTICSICKAVLKEGKTIKETGHTPGKWIVDKISDCTTHGTKHQICSVCGTTIDTVEIPMKDHQYSSVVTEATCTTDGYITYTCSVCGDTVTQVIAKSGHVDKDGDNNCDNCGAQLNPSDNCSCICHKTGFYSFIYKIIRIFWKLFRINQTCKCGATHW